MVDLERFRAALRRRGPRLLERLFTDAERRYAEGRVRGAESLAARFAAKVAARRAFGSPPLGWRDVEVVRPRGEAPSLALHGAAARAAAALGVERVCLTLTHDPPRCIGHVLLEGP